MASVYESNIYKRYFKEVGSLSKYALEHKARSGGLTGCAPVGYKNSHDGRKKTVVTDPEKAHVVQIAFRLVGESGLPLRKTLRTITKLGLVSRNGKPLGPSALRLTLFVRHNGLVRMGRHEAIVYEELFEKVQTNLSQRRKR